MYTEASNMSRENRQNQIDQIRQIMNAVEGVTLKEKKGSSFHYPLHLTRQMEETSIDSLELSVRAINSLKRAGYQTVGQFARAVADGKSLKTIRGCGTDTAREIMMNLFLFQYKSLKHERIEAYLREVASMNLNNIEHPFGTQA